jgi:hypothetical protein
MAADGNGFAAGGNADSIVRATVRHSWFRVKGTRDSRNVSRFSDYGVIGLSAAGHAHSRFPAAYFAAWSSDERRRAAPI